MFIKINDTNYFVIPDGKSVGDIFNEIFSRMNRRSITDKEKREICAEISVQLKQAKNR